MFQVTVATGIDFKWQEQAPVFTRLIFNRRELVETIEEEKWRTLMSEMSHSSFLLAQHDFVGVKVIRL